MYFYYLRPLLVPLSYSRRIDPLLTPYLLPSLNYLHLLPLLTSLGVVHVLCSKKRRDQGNTQSTAMYYERGYSGSALKVALPMFYGKGYRGSAPEVYHSRGTCDNKCILRDGAYIFGLKSSSLITLKKNPTYLWDCVSVRGITHELDTPRKFRVVTLLKRKGFPRCTQSLPGRFEQSLPSRSKKPSRSVNHKPSR